jgi:hypothetical protein
MIFPAPQSCVPRHKFSERAVQDIAFEMEGHVFACAVPRELGRE